MKQVFNRKGNIEVSEVPSPTISDGEVLVHVYYSCISAGTELSNLEDRKKSLIKRAIEKPQNIKKLLQMIQDKGISGSIAKVKSKVEGKYPIGYSAAGVVLKSGKKVKGLKPGDRVACAGAGIANHAQFIAVPQNLVVKIPDKLSLKEASTVALGAIAMQGVRRCDPKIGDFVTVIGLGILGQITVQLLNIAGCKTIGIDLDSNRLEKAETSGLYRGIDGKNTDTVKEIEKLTHGYGSDSIIITAASSDERLINQSVAMCKRKGKVIIVGDVLMNIEREEFYKKELDVLISTSYGPGRYDQEYELQGYKYPYEYIKWTETRNMEEYLYLASENKLNIDKLIEVICPVERAYDAYNNLKEENKPLMAVLEYDKEARPDTKLDINIIPTHKKITDREVINIGIIGAGSFTQEVHLPNLAKLENIYKIYGINCKTGSNAESIARQYGAVVATTDYEEIISDENIDMVLIATRHNLHAPIALKALRAGKAVFVEKPMALDQVQLNELVDTIKETGILLTVGFNRRYSPFLSEIKKAIGKRTGPVIVNYRMNAGLLPKDSWVYSEEGGGRNIGEACHIYDVFNFLTESKVTTIQALTVDSKTEYYRNEDNFSVQIKYEEGSLCNLIYTSMGPLSSAKEQMELFFDNKLYYLNDYREMYLFDHQKKLVLQQKQNKGHHCQLKSFGDYLLKKDEKGIIPLGQLIQATQISFEVENQISGQ